MKPIVLAVLASVMSSPALASEAPKPAEASIPFVNHGGINDWRDDGRDAIYVQDVHRQWYRGTFIGQCIDLPYAQAVGFETRGVDTLDRFATVIVRGQRCALNSLVKSAPPPGKAPKKAHKIEKPAPAAAAPGA